MKYKTLLLLVFTLILSQTIYAQYSFYTTGGNTQSNDMEQWSVDDMRVTVSYSSLAPLGFLVPPTPPGAFVEGSLADLAPYYGPTLYAGINWHGDNPQLDAGTHNWTGGFNVSLGVALAIEAAINVSGNVECTLSLADRGGGCAELMLAIKFLGEAGVYTGMTYVKFLGRFYRDYPDKVFDQKDNLIDPKTKEPIKDPFTGKIITKSYLDAQKAAAAAAAGGGGGSSGGGSNSSGGSGGGISIMPGVFYPDGNTTGIYLVFRSGQLVGQVTYYSDGSVVTLPKSTPDGNPPMSAKELKKAVDKYRAE